VPLRLGRGGEGQNDVGSYDTVLGQKREHCIAHPGGDTVYVPRLLIGPLYIYESRGGCSRTAQNSLRLQCLSSRLPSRLLPRGGWEGSEKRPSKHPVLHEDSYYTGRVVPKLSSDHQHSVVVQHHDTLCESCNTATCRIMSKFFIGKYTNQASTTCANEMVLMHMNTLT
jgi:hypothetical protein